MTGSEWPFCWAIPLNTKRHGVLIFRNLEILVFQSPFIFFSAFYIYVVLFLRLAHWKRDGMAVFWKPFATINCLNASEVNDVPLSQINTSGKPWVASLSFNASIVLAADADCTVFTWTHFENEASTTKNVITWTWFHFASVWMHRDPWRCILRRLANDAIFCNIWLTPRR